MLWNVWPGEQLGRQAQRDWCLHQQTNHELPGRSSTIRKQEPLWTTYESSPLDLLSCGDVHPNPGPVISVAQLNIGGIAHHKMPLLLAEAQNAHLILLQELKTSVQSISTLIVPGYECIGQARNARGGGVGILVRQNCGLRYEKMAGVGGGLGAEVVVIKLYAEGTPVPLLIANVYFAPPARVPVALLRNVFVPSAACLLAGDVNAHFPTWSALAATDAGDEVNDWLSDLGFETANDPAVFTRPISASSPHVTAGHLVLVFDWRASPVTFSDHAMIRYSVAWHDVPTKEKVRGKATWSFRRADWDQFSRSSERLFQALPAADVEKMSNQLTETVNKAAMNAIPKGLRQAAAPIWTDAMAAAHSRAKHLLVAFLQFPDDETSRNEYVASKQILDEVIVREMRVLLHSRWATLSSASAPSWQYLRGKYRPQAAFSSVVDGLADPRTISRRLVRHWARYNVGGCRHRRLHLSQGRSSSLSSVEFLSALRHLGSGTAPGPDDVHSDMVHHRPTW